MSIMELAPLTTNAAFRRRLKRAQLALLSLESGANGQTLTLGKADGRSIVHLLGRLGFELLSETAIKKKGHVLKKDELPFLRCYYGAPVKKYVALYLFGVQTKATS
jgi:hypothetical protein